MASLFSIVFAGIFLAFILAAIVGHALLIGALLRPFFVKAVPAPVLLWHGLRAQSAL